eukprot:550210-Heterocapsa_arctica.AAC.1
MALQSSGILAITGLFLAERLSCCTQSELDTKFELQQHAPAYLFCLPCQYCVVQNILAMYTCACAPVGPPYVRTTIAIPVTAT